MHQFDNIFKQGFVRYLHQIGGTVHVVGGVVRDAILLKQPKDIDLIVTGIPTDDIIGSLEQFGKVDLVGESFGVFKFRNKEDGQEYDVSLPRSDSPGKEFVVRQEPILENLIVFKILYGGPINENNKM